MRWLAVMPRRQVLVPGQATTLSPGCGSPRPSASRPADDRLDVAGAARCGSRGSGPARCGSRRGRGGAAAPRVPRSCCGRRVPERHRRPARRRGRAVAARTARAARRDPAPGPSYGRRTTRPAGASRAACAARARSNASSKRSRKPVCAEALDEELDARLRALRAIRVRVVQLDHRFHRGDQLVLGNERAHDDRLARLVAETAAGEQLEAGLAVLHASRRRRDRAAGPARSRSRRRRS